jgi:hypothetical protein
MSVRKYGSVVKEFPELAEQAFSFLESEAGFAGPEFRDDVTTSLTYSRNGTRFQVQMDHFEKSVMTNVEVDYEDGFLVLPISSLVDVLGIESRNKVPRITHSLSDLRKVLNAQADLARKVQPHLAREALIETMKAADARKWTYH